MTICQAQLGVSPRGHGPHVPYSPLYDDVYHSEFGAWEQAREVFLQGNGLPRRWQGTIDQRRQRFVILETGFGLGNNFLATWAAWRADPQRCQHLVFISVEKHPLGREDLAAVHSRHEEIADEAEGSALSQRLIDAWPPLTPGMHTLEFDETGLGDTTGEHHPPFHMTLLLALGDVKDMIPALMASVDAFYLDGFSPARNPDMWDAHWISRLNRLAAPGATAATWTVACDVHDALTQAGFVVGRADAFGSQRDFIHAGYAPRFQAPLPPGGLWPAPDVGLSRSGSGCHHAVVIGSGLAGAVSAWALCREGWRVTVLDQHAEPAQEASGNPGGLFHSIVHGEDGLHARAHRAAALQVAALASGWITSGRLAGQCEGLLRLDASTNPDEARSLLSKLSLPTDHVRFLNQAEAQAWSGAQVPSGGWLFQQGGWLAPGEFVRTLLADAQASGRLKWLGNCAVSALNQASDGQWQARGRDGRLIAEGAALVLANGQASQGLLSSLPDALATSPLPMGRVRGQISRLGQNMQLAPTALARPVAGSGYALRLDGGDVLCGATSHHHDEDPTIRDADHAHNLQQAWRLGVWGASDGAMPDITASALPNGLQGRVGWRATTPDRLPLVGALPLPLAALRESPKAVRLEQPRWIPRRRSPQGGLFILSGLGSRGITWSVLAGRLLAHWVTGSPCPVEADLRDALDPARWLSREATHTKRHVQP
jgi:tRNA 5-methylaminomethyl-2-thiouridine biosynthesis bifunctional protein